MKQAQAKHKICRRIGYCIWNMAKCPSVKRPYAAGLQGKNGKKKKLSTYGEMMQENNPAAGAKSIGKTMELLYSTFAVPHKKEESPILNAALSYISAHLESPVDITGLCRSVGVSKSTLARIFAANGLAVPSKYWRNRTLQLATFLLLNTEMSMKEIAFRLGFASQFHFSRVFAENVGKSPREFRKTAFR